MISALFFYAFAAMTLAAAIMVIVARNPVHAVFFLILSFFSAAGLFVLMGAEFIAMLLVVVYVGAVAVLMLFVVMMLDVDFSTLQAGKWQKHLPLAGVLGIVLLAELALILFGESESNAVGVAPLTGTRSNIERIGDVLYSDHIFVFQTAGVILLVAMIGAITLTMRQREGVKRQNIMAQTMRRRDESIEVVPVASGSIPAAIAMHGGEARKLTDGDAKRAGSKRRRMRKRRGDHA